VKSRLALALALIAALGLLNSDPFRVEEPVPIQVSEERVYPRVQYQAQQSSTPNRVRIEKLGVDAPVISVGMVDEITMEIPEDIAIAGWFQYSARPGSSGGSMVIVGHRDGITDPNGVFRDLGRLRQGHALVVADSDGLIWDYRVSSVELLGKEEFAQQAERIFDTEGPSRLVLLTCGGSYDRERGGYQANVVVTAYPR
jgi:LPXTG-site transpeptidase (sortase) family protein